jgi:hypothetical protein
MSVNYLTLVPSRKIKLKLPQGSVILGGVMVSMHAIGPKVHRFKPCPGQWIVLRAIKSTAYLLRKGSIDVSPML